MAAIKDNVLMSHMHLKLALTDHYPMHLNVLCIISSKLLTKLAQYNRVYLEVAEWPLMQHGWAGGTLAHRVLQLCLSLCPGSPSLCLCCQMQAGRSAAVQPAPWPASAGPAPHEEWRLGC